MVSAGLFAKGYVTVAALCLLAFMGATALELSGLAKDTDKFATAAFSCCMALAIPGMLFILMMVIWRGF